MKEKFYREVVVYGNDFWEFYNSKSSKVQKKIDWIICLVQSLEIIPENFFKKIKGADGLFEIRIKSLTNIYRIFCFFDEGNLVILLNGFHKKKQKTPRKEIDKALKLRKNYYEDKKQIS